MGEWIRDIRYAARSMAAARKFAAIVVATLALGIGANTAVFGVLNAVVLEPLPYPEPDQLVRVYQFAGGSDSYMPGPRWSDFARAAERSTSPRCTTIRRRGRT